MAGIAGAIGDQAGHAAGSATTGPYLDSGAQGELLAGSRHQRCNRLRGPEVAESVGGQRRVRRGGAIRKADYRGTGLCTSVIAVHLAGHREDAHGGGAAAGAMAVQASLARVGSQAGRSATTTATTASPTTTAVR